MLLAREIMTSQVICIHKDTPVFDAVDLMVTNSITGIPVIEDDSALVGILSEQDVLRLFETYEDEKSKTVTDFMTQPAIHFEENERVEDICSCMMQNSIRRVPITSNGRVVGVISRSDILKQILNLGHKNLVQS
ncbi:MAG: CBS domain-containing protein [Sedimentisphaerales bacterium]